MKGRKTTGQKPIVTIQKNYPFTTRCVDTFIACVPNPSIHLVAEKCEAVLSVFLDYRINIVGRTIVNNNHFIALPVLTDDAVQCVRQRLGTIKDWNYDTEKRIGHVL